MKAFGPPHAHPDLETSETPVGESCLWCEEKIEENDQGFVVACDPTTRPAGWSAFHRPCWIRQISGSVGHLLGKCSCRGGNMEDPPDMTKRQAAEAAMNLYLIKRPQVEDPREVGIPKLLLS